VSDPPDARSRVRNGSKRREVTQMSKTKKLLAASLGVLAIAAVPSTSIALSGSGASVPVACGSGGSTGCG